MPESIFVGVDVGKQWLDVATVGSTLRQRFRNEPNGIEKLVSSLVAMSPTLVAMESTAGYERRLLEALQKAGIDAARVEPRRTRDFARAMGIQAKTDAIDAGAIASFAAAVRPMPTLARTAACETLAELSKRRADLIEMRTQERNRLEHYRDKAVIKSVKKHIEQLNKAVDDLDAQMCKLIRSEPAMLKRDEIQREMPGIGLVTSAVLIARLPELGSLSRQKVASLVGLAPFNRDSGKKHGERCVRGGRSDVRTLLYMATLSAIRVDPELSGFYKRLRASGKPAKVAIVACMRKQLVRLNAKMREASRQQLAAAQG